MQAQMQQAVKIMGISMHHLRKRCRDGIPMMYPEDVFNKIIELPGYSEEDKALHFIPANELKENWSPAKGSKSICVNILKAPKRPID